MPVPADAYTTGESAPDSLLVKVGVPLLGALSLIGLAGCGPSTPPPPAVTQSQPVTPAEQSQALPVKPGVSVYDGTRIDIIRQTETETESDGDSHTEDVDLSPFGVDLGDGLFLDLNGNLSYQMSPELVVRDPQDLEYQVPTLRGGHVTATVRSGAEATVISTPTLLGGPREVRVVQRGADTVIEEPALFGGPIRTTIHREGNETVISRPGLGGPVVLARVIDRGSHTEVRQPALGGDVRITIDHAGNTTTIRQPALFRPIVTTIQDSGTDVSARFPGGSTTMRRIDSTHYVVEHRGLGTARAEISRQGGSFEVKEPTLFGRPPVVRITEHKPA